MTLSPFNKIYNGSGGFLYKKCASATYAYYLGQLLPF